MKQYEVITMQEENGHARVIHKEFDDYGAARQYADDICDDNRTVKCSIYKGEYRCLVMDVL